MSTETNPPPNGSVEAAVPAAGSSTAVPAADPQSHAGDTPATTAERAAAKVPDVVDRAGDNTPTKPGTEAAKASSGLADHSKHPPGERAEGAAVAISGDEKNQK